MVGMTVDELEGFLGDSIFIRVGKVSLIKSR